MMIGSSGAASAAATTRLTVATTTSPRALALPGLSPSSQRIDDDIKSSTPHGGAARSAGVTVDIRSSSVAAQAGDDRADVTIAAQSVQAETWRYESNGERALACLGNGIEITVESGLIEIGDPAGYVSLSRLGECQTASQADGVQRWLLPRGGALQLSDGTAVTFDRQLAYLSEEGKGPFLAYDVISSVTFSKEGRTMTVELDGANRDGSRRHMEVHDGGPSLERHLAAEAFFAQERSGVLPEGVYAGAAPGALTPEALRPDGPAGHATPFPDDPGLSVVLGLLQAGADRPGSAGPPEERANPAQDLADADAAAMRRATAALLEKLLAHHRALVAPMKQTQVKSA